MANKEIQVMYSDLMNIHDLAESLGKALVFIENKNMVPIKLFVPAKIHKQLEESETFLRSITIIHDEKYHKTIFGVPFEVSKTNGFAISFTHREPIRI